jgi:hypothetical protein
MLWTVEDVTRSYQLHRENKIIKRTYSPKKTKEKEVDSCVFFTDHRTLRTIKDLGMKMAMKRN